LVTGLMPTLYYIDRTKNGRRELIAIDTETDTHVKGRIISSEVTPEDIGTRWSNTKKNISNKEEYNFTLEPPYWANYEIEN